MDGLYDRSAIYNNSWGQFIHRSAGFWLMNGVSCRIIYVRGICVWKQNFHIKQELELSEEWKTKPFQVRAPLIRCPAFSFVQGYGIFSKQIWLLIDQFSIEFKDLRIEKQKQSICVCLCYICVYQCRMGTIRFDMGSLFVFGQNSYEKFHTSAKKIKWLCKLRHPGPNTQAISVSFSLSLSFTRFLPFFSFETTYFRIHRIIYIHNTNWEWHN